MASGDAGARHLARCTRCRCRVPNGRQQLHLKRHPYLPEPADAGPGWDLREAAPGPDVEMAPSELTAWLKGLKPEGGYTQKQLDSAAASFWSWGALAPFCW